MSAAYKAGVVVGIVFVIIIFTALYRILKVNKNGKWNTDYDEKQMAVRGIGYKYGFFTILIYNAVLIVLSVLEVNLPMRPEMILCLGIFLSAIVFASYSIWNDAYIGLNMNAKGYSIFMISIGVINLLIGAFALKDQRVYVDGQLQTPFMNLLCFFAFALIGIEMILKSIKDKKEEAQED
ncbi:MAG: hypothetical protein K5739_11400 [Lachnospiraceae bacterium]|nr:hypothetical protein [Lachnospiraceae bacterium]